MLVTHKLNKLNNNVITNHFKFEYKPFSWVLQLIKNLLLAWWQVLWIKTYFIIIITKTMHTNSITMICFEKAPKKNYFVK